MLRVLTAAPTGVVSDSPIKIGETHGYANLGCSAERVWEWLQRTPVWPALTAGMTLSSVKLDCAGHANGWMCGPEPLALGLPVVVQFSAPHTFSVQRQSWSVFVATVAVNEDGTRGTVVETEVVAGPDESGELAAEGFAWQQGGGIPDVD